MCRFSFDLQRFALNNYKKNTSVKGTSAADTINNYAGGATLKGNNGNDYIFNSTSINYTIKNSYGYVTIDGGAGNDTIYNFDPKVSIAGGTGNDKISVFSSNAYNGVTINGGTGNDTIYGNSLDGGILYQYKKGDGNDLIYNFSISDTLSISGSSYSTKTSGNNILVNIASGGKITLVGAKGKPVNIVPKTSKALFTNNQTKNKSVNGSSYADTINNSAGGATLKGGNGNDYIFSSTNTNHTINSGFGYVTIDGGAGNDSILSYDPNVSISGGAGNDLISLKSSDFNGVTINGGTGNDTIYGDSLGGGVLYQYKKGDGNDIIYGYTANDSITISGSTYTTSKSGNNILVNVANSGKITLVGAKDKALNIYPAKSSSTVNPAVSQQDVIKKFMKVLDTTNNAGISALNQAVKEASGGYFTNINEVRDKMIADCQKASSYSDFLTNYCGIILDNNDTGAITGSDMGGTTAKNNSSIVPESGSLHSFTGSSFTVNGVTFQLATVSGGSPTDISYSDLTDETQKYIWQAMETWWAKSALDLIAQSYGSNYAFGSGATVKKIYVSFYEGSSYLASTSGYFADSSRKTINKLSLRINMSKYKTLIIGNKDGKTSDRDIYYLDRILAHELTHCVMYANVNYSDELPNLIREGLAELTHGSDDDRKSDIVALAKDPSRLKNALMFDSYDAYAGGYMFMRYLAKQASEHYPLSGTSKSVSALRSKSADSSGMVSVSGNTLTAKKGFAADTLDVADYSSSVKIVDATLIDKGVMIIGNATANIISAGAGDDSIFANTGRDTINGGAGNDFIYGDSGNDSINGGDGNDTLFGGAGLDTLTGGNGNDIFVFNSTSSADVITDYTSGKDKIKLAGSSVISTSVSGSDLILNLGNSNSIRIKNGKDKNITIIDKDGNETTKNYTNATLKITNSTKSPVTLASNVLTANAASRTTAVKITGNSLANIIIGGSGNDTLYGGVGNDSISGNAGNDKIYGGSGNDTLWGGAGNDSLWGNNGADTFVYSSGEGNDVIFGFDNSDMLKITGTFSGTYNKSKKEIYFKVASTSNAITLKDFSATTFNVNGDDYKISGTKLVKK